MWIGFFGGQPQANSVYLIKVELLAAKNLIGANLNGTSDPYAIITCCGENCFSNSQPLVLTPMGEACLRMDLTAIHEILDKAGYKDDEGIANELSFQMWTNQMQETLNSKKQGDGAFRAKDINTAIDCYTQFIDGGTMVSPTVYAQRCLCYLMGEMPNQALGDVMEALVVSPDWPTTFHLQAAALFTLGMENDMRHKWVLNYLGVDS